MKLSRLITFLFLFSLPFMVSAQHEYESTLDTITNTEQDTVTFSKTIRNPHTVGLQCQFTELSGASNITLFLEGSVARAGNLWTVIAQDTIVNGVNSATLYLVVPSSAQNCQRYRYRVSGDSGATQSQQYFCAVATKEDN